MPSFGHMLNLATSPCHSVGFCIVLFLALELNSRAVSSEACISAAKYEYSEIFWKPALKSI